MRLLFFHLMLSVGTLWAAVNPQAEMLAKAAVAGDLKTTQNLLELGVSPDLVDQYGMTPLCHAVSANDHKTAELLLAYHADPNTMVSRQTPDLKFPATPLQYAAYMGNLNLIYTLAQAGAQINMKAPSGRTALHFAVMEGHLDVIRVLIAKGADVSIRDMEGTSAFDDAVWNGDLDVAAILLAHGARLNEIEPKSGATPVNEAAYRGNTSVVRYLLQFNPDLGIPDKHGHLPLENAVARGKEEAALLLLAAESKERETPHFLETTMETALRKNEAMLVAALVRRGAPVNEVLPSGATPLDVAAFGGSSKTVSVLLENHADPNVSGRNGSSALEDALLKGFDSIAGMLLDHGALVNQINEGSGTTALYSAASFGKGDVVKLLLKRGAKPNLCGKNRKTPYQVAVDNGSNELATEIQNHGGGKTCEP